MRENLKFNNFFKCCAAFVLGLATAALFGFKLFYIPLVLFFLAFLITLIFKKQITYKRLWFLFLSAFLGAFWVSFHIFFCYIPALKFDGSCNLVCGTVSDIQLCGVNGECYIINVNKIGSKRFIIPFKLKMFVKRGIDCGYSDEIKINMRLKKICKSDWFFLFDGNISKGIYLKSSEFYEGEIFEKNSFFSKFLQIRDSLMNSIDLFVKEPYNLLAAGMLFGNSSRIPYNMKRVANRCGIAHIFAISGLHIVILASVLIFILKLFKCRDNVTFIFLAICFLIYLFMVGFSPSASRACLMALASYFGSSFNKKIKPLYCLIFAAFIISIIWPTCILGMSFLLSFSSCLGIILLANKISNFLLIKMPFDRKWFVCLIQGFGTSLAAQAFSSFFLMFTFGKISIVAPFVNILIIQIVPIIYISTALVAVFGLFSTYIATYIGYFCESLFDIVFSFLTFISKFPFCYIPTNYFIVKFIVGCLAVFMFFYFIIFRRFISVRSFFSICGAIIGMPFFLNFVNKDLISINVFKIGSSVGLVIIGKNRCVVVDCGLSDFAARSFLEFLDSKGVRDVDILICAPLKNNVCRGAFYILNFLQTRNLVLSEKAGRRFDINNIVLNNTKLIPYKDFHLELFPIIVDAVHLDRDFGFYLNLNGINFSYSEAVFLFLNMNRKKHTNLAILGESLDYFDGLDGLFKKNNFGRCLGLFGGNFNNSYFEAVRDDSVTEFVVDRHYLKRRESNNL